jgi:hypothetical protein
MQRCTAGSHAVDLIYTVHSKLGYAVLHEKNREAGWCDVLKGLRTGYASKVDPKKK